MKNSEWLQIETIFHKALSLDHERRAGYLGEVCSGSESLRSEVETLLAAYESSNGFMEQPALEFGLELLRGKESDPLPGRTIGPYLVIEAIGRGGMGEVYLAEDTRLGRKVALKFLSADFVGDKWAKRQLIKEAQAVAMLDHPNICPVYGFEDIDGLTFIVMQYVEGETLAALIAERRINASQIVPLAKQIVSALVESHAHSIIHRDIKPKNIMVTPGGQVKVLDFGLATNMLRRKSLETGADSHVSQAGLIQGTVAYMSPEQLRARRLDFRSDIFSVGTVLYELISGKRPFARDCEAEVISAILSASPPPLAKTEGGNGHELSQIVLRCLEKEKTKRYQSFSEVLYDLGNLDSENGTKAKHAISFAWIAAAILVVVSVVVAVIYFNTRTSRVYSLAVVPVSNNSNNPNLDYLEDALPTSLIAKLSRLSNLKVKALTVLAQFQSDTADPFQIGKDFEVDAVLLGTIVNDGSGEVLQASLIDTKNRAEIWREQYQLAGATALSVQSRLSEKIASTLQLRLGVAERRVFEKHDTNSEEAFQEYLRGSHYWRFRDQENIRKAINHFKAAIDLDPAFARAHAGLSACYALLNTTAYGDMPTAEAMNRAHASAEMALTIDPSLPEAHTALGLVNLKYVWDWPESEKEFQIALSINPEDASAHYWYSNLLTILGRRTEAMQEAERARQIDPHSSAARMNFCRQYYYDRRFYEAAGCLKEILKEDPSAISAKHVLGYVYYQLGQHEDAIRSFQELPDTGKALKLVSLGYVYGRAGRQQEALRELAELKQMSERGYVPPQEFAVIYLGLGDKDQVFFWLNKAYAERFAGLAYLTADPAFDAIKDDPRFEELAGRMKLPMRN